MNAKLSPHKTLPPKKRSKLQSFPHQKKISTILAQNFVGTLIFQVIRGENYFRKRRNEAAYYFCAQNICEKFFCGGKIYLLWKAIRGMNMREEGDVSKRGDWGISYEK